jgi:hypothetical protein
LQRTDHFHARELHPRLKAIGVKAGVIHYDLAHQVQDALHKIYVKDMRQAHRAAGMVCFPSLFEGYGLTAVEPMYGGVPVVSGSYPAIFDAVGEAAYTLCPHKSTKEEWRQGGSSQWSGRTRWTNNPAPRMHTVPISVPMERAKKNGLRHFCCNPLI